MAQPLTAYNSMNSIKIKKFKNIKTSKFFFTSSTKFFTEKNQIQQKIPFVFVFNG